MFSSLAWLRALFILALTFTRSTARDNSIFTSSVTYCNPPETLLISRFEVAYFPGNSSVVFNVSAASVEPDVNVNANIFLNVYGMRPLNVTIDLCNILGGALCPLPMYNFTGADTITLPDSLGINGKIPAIALSIPDLEGFAQLTLTEVGTGAVKACVQATLGNGWSAHQRAVEWTMGGVAIAAALVSFGVSLFFADSILPFRFLDLIFLFQTIASSALLSLNYPSVYRAFALNFSWALGLFPASESSPIQRSINSMRHRTGGSLADAAQGGAVQFVNRRLSPYNNAVALARRDASIVNLLKRAAVNVISLVTRQSRQTIKGEVQTVTNDSVNVLDAGLPIYVNSLHIATGNAFMTVFICALMLFAIGLTIVAFGYGVSLWVNRSRKSVGSLVRHLNFARSWILRLSLIVLGPLLIFIMFQWTLNDSWASILLSVLTLVALIGIIGFAGFSTFRLAVRRSQFELYSPDHKNLQANGPLYTQYRASCYWFFAVTILAMLLRAIFIAFVKSQAEAQIALFVTVEALLVIAHITLKPYSTRGGDIFGTYLAIVRFVATGLLIAFLESLNVAPIPRVVIGFVVMVVHCTAVLVVIFNLVQCLYSLLVAPHFGEKRTGSAGSAGSDGSILEKGRSSDSECGSEVGRDAVRPHNPTPHQGSPVDSSILPPFPISPTGTTVTTMEPPSPYARDSDSAMTFGSVMPSRWSISWSQPNSPAPSSSRHGTSVRESLQFSSSSPGQTSDGYLSRRTSESIGGHSAPMSAMHGSPSAWRPASSGGSSVSHGHGRLVRQSSSKALEIYQQNHQRISEDGGP